MNKLNTIAFSLAALAGTALLTSCLDSDGTNKYYGTGFFTIEKEGTTYNLWNDGGGLVRPTAQSVIDLVGQSGFQNGERVALDFTYTDDCYKEVAGKGMYIDNVELYQGQRLEKINILFKEDAEAKNLLAADSIFPLSSDIAVWAYRGYLTAQHKGVFSVVNGKGVYPTLNMIYDKEENGAPNTLKLKMVYNRHTAKDTGTSNQYFFSTYPLTMMSNFITGSDSITVSVEGQGLSKPLSFKIGRQDLVPGNYRYFDMGTKLSNN